MTAGYAILGCGAVIMAAAIISTVVVAVTAPKDKQKIEQRMREKY